MKHPLETTALIIVDPFNDFLSKKGGAWPMLKSTLGKENVIEHLSQLLEWARLSNMTIAYAPHHRYEKGSHSGRKYLHPAQIQQLFSKAFEKGKLGGEFFPLLAPKQGEFIAEEHQCSSGFAGTNLDEHLQSKNITHLIIVGLITNSCIEATVRSAIDLDYHITLVTDAVGAFSPIEHQQALDERYPLLAHHVTTTSKFIEMNSNND